MNQQPTTPTLPAQPPPAPPGALAAVEAFYAAGHWLYTQERFDDAVTVFRAVIRLAPHDERGWLALGACNEALDRHDVALELYDEARRVASTAPRCGLARARILRVRGMHDDAREAFAEAEQAALQMDDDELCALIAAERRRA
jgi:tetratricopeptide (TPR) repeat protein